jgi:poly-gamma-glutamate capsule biosynthesis protein CapA/YwtB (metallophosphatase superfamily)
MVHWGIPYERSPLEEDRAKARRFIDLGADAVIGHHPHILQPIEIYKGRPILYSVGNFAFGSGNSKAESILPCLRFHQSGIEMDVFPIYVQNRDPRLNYQPKVIGGTSGRATIDRLLSMSPNLECKIERQDYCLRLSISDEIVE